MNRVNKYTAVMLDYNGIECQRVECFDSSKPVFFVRIKQFDLAAIQAEMQDKTLPVFLAPLLDSLKKIDGLLEQARVSGVWTEVRNNEFR
jgi:hypothetical protein